MLLLRQHLWQLMLVALGGMLFSGLPVAVVLIGIGLAFGLLGCGLGLVQWQDFGIIYYRIFGNLFNTEDVFWSAVPLLLFMGLVLYHSGIAAEMQACLQRLLRRVPAGLALATFAMGALLSPAAGMIGASVVTLALISLPEMLDRGYRTDFSAGTVAAAGTLGVALPPGIMLVFVADAMGVYTPYIFLAMIGPGLLLLTLFASYCLIAAPRVQKPAICRREGEGAVSVVMLVRSLLLPIILLVSMILAVTMGQLPISQSAAVGAGGALLLSMLAGRCKPLVLQKVVTQTATVTAMVFFIYMGASVFNLMFRLVGGIDAVAAFLSALRLGSWGTLGFILLILFALGFFIDWIELVVVSFAIFRPALESLDFSSIIHSQILAYSWITVLITMTLQVSFLTPPFGYALFFLKGAAPDLIRMRDVYRGIIPFVILALISIGCVAAFPAIATWLPSQRLSTNVQPKINAID